jgi:glycosyltransferase involved in cell wall biosynthesis
VADAALSGPPFEVIFVTMSPWMSGDAARELAERSGKPWVADLRDPWVFDEMQFYPSGIHRFLEGRRMKRMLGAADAVVMNTEEARARLLRRWPHLRRKRVEVITNGYDEADFAGPPPQVDEAKFRIVHTGHLHTELGGPKEMHARIRTLTGGRVRHVDFMTRSHVYLLQAVERVLGQRPDLRDRIEVHLAGGLSPADEAAITLDCVKTYGYINHAESVEVLRSADLLFLPMQNLPPGRRATIVPGKTYEYLASGRPILAALPDGDARDLLSRFERAAVVRPGDIDGMAHAILERVDIPREPDAPRVGLEQYERRDQARRLAELLAAVTGS